MAASKNFVLSTALVVHCIVWWNIQLLF